MSLSLTSTYSFTSQPSAVSGVPQALIGSHRQSLPTFGKAGDGVLSAHSAEGSRILDALRHLPPAVHMGGLFFQHYQGVQTQNLEGGLRS